MKLFVSIENNEERNHLISLIDKINEIDLVDKIEDNTIVLTNGPLTELSNLLLKDYTLCNKIEKILLIGGSDSYGDVTPLAEKNIYADPSSAQHVFLSSIPIVMFGLNVTRDLNNRSLLALAYLLKPELFKEEECGVFVETKAKKSLGMSVTDLYSDKQFDKHYVKMILEYDKESYNKLINDIK